MEKKDYFAYWLTGFTDGEGCFSVSFNKRDRLKLGIEVRPSFSICQSGRREAFDSKINILNEIQAYFKCGFIRTYKADGMYKYEVRNVSDLHTHIIPHFEKYPLLTVKNKDFVNFKTIIRMMRSNLHMNKQGLTEIINLAFIINPSGKRKNHKEELMKYIS
jgi:hypothetical protein